MPIGSTTCPRRSIPYSPSLDMVTSLKTTGLPGTTERALLGDRSTLGSGSCPRLESYLWDQGAALFLLESRGFVQVGGHWEASFTPQRFRERWIWRSMVPGSGSTHGLRQNGYL